MKKAKLAFVAVTLSYLLTDSAANAAVETATLTRDSVPQDAISYGEIADNPDTQPADSIAKLTQLALGGMSDLGGILTSDLPAPSSRSASAANQSIDDRLAIGGATDAAPTWSQHGKDGEGGPGHGGFGPGMGAPGMGKPGFGMAACRPMLGHHFRCPWERLEGAYALTDDQYQKLYDIKGQFIASIVPKGLNVWMLGRKMKDLLNVGDVDTAAVKDVEKQIAAATSDLSMTAMDSIITANQVLTPEQRKELHRISIRSTLGGSGHRHHDKESHPEK